MSATRHITAPKGFVAAGVCCGLKASGKKDLAIIAAEHDVAAAIVTTRNQVVGAPIRWCRSVLPKGHGKVRAIVINAGNANACTGPRGLRDARAMAKFTASRLRSEPQRILVASTGIIGEPLDMAKIRRGIDSAAAKLDKGNDRDALRAIMTTDTREKHAVARLQLGRRTALVAGIAKGSGMIAPNMATMIAVLTTDAPVTPAALHKALAQATADTFNAITVDGDTSTSDIAVLLASGRTGGEPITTRSGNFGRLAESVRDVCATLAEQIIADGEGATKVILITIASARSDAEAHTAAKAVANSPLVKCAIGGADPNVGRIAAALGKSSAEVDPDRLHITIGTETVMRRGAVVRFDSDKLRRYLRGERIEIRCELGLGRGVFTAMTCDLTRQYVTINADYHT